MNFGNIIDDYITREDKPVIIGHCNNCGDLIEQGMDYTKLEGQLYCNDECIEQYFEVEEHTLVEYCAECDYSISESYIKDIYDNKFCDLECLKEYYK